MPGKSRSAEPADTKLLKAYCSLREAFNFVGTKVYGPKWQGIEADCDPARERQQTDAKSLLRKLAPGGRSFSTEEKDRRPVPKRPIDDKDGVKLRRAIGRHIKALKEFLRLTHNGLLPAEFIPENESTAREGINASAWPDPEKFNPKKPSWGELWFDIAADRVVLKSPGPSANSSHGRDYGDLWWAYTGRPGRVEIERGALEKALSPPKDNGIGLSKEAQKKGGARRKYHKGLQSFINKLSMEFAETGKSISLVTVKDWLLENAGDKEPLETCIVDCDEVEFVEDALYWKDRHGSPHHRRASSLEPYIQRAKQR